MLIVSPFFDIAVVPITNVIASDSSLIDTMNNRADIIENQQGAPLSIYLRSINRTAIVDACNNAQDGGEPMDYTRALLNNVQGNTINIGIMLDNAC